MILVLLGSCSFRWILRMIWYSLRVVENKVEAIRSFQSWTARPKVQTVSKYPDFRSSPSQTEQTHNNHHQLSTVAMVSTQTPGPPDRPEKRQKTEPSPPGLLLTDKSSTLPNLLLPPPPHHAHRPPPIPSIADLTVSDVVRLRVWDPLPSQTPKYIDFTLHVAAIKTKTKMLDYFLIHPAERNGATAADAAPFSIRQIGVGPDVFKCFVEWAYVGDYDRALEAYVYGAFLEGRNASVGAGEKDLGVPEGWKLKVHLEVYQCARCLGCVGLGKAAYQALFVLLKQGIPLDREENDSGFAACLVTVFNPKDESPGLIGIREMLVAYLGSRLPEAMGAPHITGVISIIPNLSLSLLRRVQIGKEFEATLPEADAELF
ncbi:hypothetical protein BJ508DRAFT_375512 [Ascobolus immersus RN42]|uniref:BTB domain-containing protein n=1 Tax=Ascobolus immersus RN42 TaxID=1160509 RepID=A0A3N4I9L6_ASCIM|nr:hypothetical protein BJ508DRAFT_375512 [Ascobolus immersus RN42]